MWNPFRHRHKWRGTFVNIYGIEIEQRCKCGAYRHHLLADFRWLDEPNWRDGKHPSPDPK